MGALRGGDLTGRGCRGEMKALILKPRLPAGSLRSFCRLCCRSRECPTRGRHRWLEPPEVRHYVSRAGPQCARSFRKDSPLGWKRERGQLNIRATGKTSSEEPWTPSQAPPSHPCPVLGGRSLFSQPISQLQAGMALYSSRESH